ncbi:MAG: hypothetical protein LBK23_01475 [Oscillospiraceae bacterium]|jgi:hypothetical protein|nr:hypothetical protein [Oscillospiraceae bacterium]
MNKNPKSNPFEDELDSIRIKLYEQTKDMTRHERVTFFHDMAKEGFERHGLTPRYANLPIVRRQAQP